LLWSACEPERPSWVELAEAAHQEADAARTDAEEDAARRRLERAYREVPAGEDPSLTWVRQDLCARVGDMALRRGDAQAALHWAERGLGLVASANLARADLLRVKGQALEVLGKPGAAAAALHEALRLNQELMDRALRGEPVQGR
jgi:hypothetical protein